eukprot:TRINITY_DN1298_c0_g1_i4.p1 TRINITY_DN1298_c0_g1~~TRINITY_DN1298_c0_g1_i4.p1  ORF type:complete len:377 (+),score=127.68 TRINITY_DN1298_c0_g1_i4:230-1360(+)
MVLCKAGLGRSIYRADSDLEAIRSCPQGYHSVYVPSAAEEAADPCGPGAVFTDTYLMYDSALVVPTHVISYHLEVNQSAISDGDLLSWTIQRCQETFGFTEHSFAHYFINLACTSESHQALAVRLRDQADVPPHLADSFAADLYQRVVVHGQTSLPTGIPPIQEVDNEQLTDAMVLLGVSQDTDGGPPVPAGVHQVEEAVEKIQHCMAELEELGLELQESCDAGDAAAAEFDQQLFERASKFKAELVTYLKEYMLTLQVAEERVQEMTRAIDDAFNMNEFMTSQKNAITKVAMLTQWKNMLGLREDLKRRLAPLTTLKGKTLAWLSPTADDQQIDDLERQASQKQRVIELLQQRLEQLPRHELMQEDVALLEICQS